MAHESERTPGHIPRKETGREEPDRADDTLLQISLARLARLAMGSGETALQSFLLQVAQYAMVAVPGAEGARVMLFDEERADTVVSTADFINDITKIERNVGEGPCLSAARDGVTMRSGSLFREKSWPRFGPRVAGLGVNSVLSLPLISDARVLGALSLYAHPPGAFESRAVDLGESFAEPAGVSVYGAQALYQSRQLTARLEAALTDRSPIDQAIGILRSRSGDDSEEAFERIRSLSQAQGRKVGSIAQELVQQAVRRARARNGA